MKSLDTLISSIFVKVTHCEKSDFYIVDLNVEKENDSCWQK